jgi:predicted transcriptional regulator
MSNFKKFASTPILLSLQPEYFQLAIKGKKQYEYRKQFRGEPTTAVIYVSSPTKEIKGVFDFGKPVTGDTQKITEIARQDPANDPESVRSYIQGSKPGYAVPIKKTFECDPITLKELRRNFPEFQPPQMYFLLNKKPELLRLLQNNLIQH